MRWMDVIIKWSSGGWRVLELRRLNGRYWERPTFCPPPRPSLEKRPGIESTPWIDPSRPNSSTQVGGQAAAGVNQPRYSMPMRNADATGPLSWEQNLIDRRDEFIVRWCVAEKPVIFVISKMGQPSITRGTLCLWRGCAARPVLRARTDLVGWLVGMSSAVGVAQTQKYSCEPGQKKDEERCHQATQRRETMTPKAGAKASQFFMHNSGLADRTVRLRVSIGVSNSLTTPKALLKTSSTARSFGLPTDRPTIDRFRALIAEFLVALLLLPAAPARQIGPLRSAVVRSPLGPTVGRSIHRMHQLF